MTVVSDRIGFKELCISTLQAHFAATEGLTAVTVHYDDFGETPANEMVILGRIEGNSDQDVFGPSGSTDEFTIDSAIISNGHESSEVADRRCQVLLNAVNAALFQDRFGRALGATAWLGKQDGPNADPPLDGNPAVSIVEFQITVRISLRGN